MNLKRHHVLYSLLAVSLIIALLVLLLPDVPNSPVSLQQETQEPTKVSTTTSGIQFEVVNSPELHEKGLSGRESIPQNYGMLFVFPTPDQYGFWMKGMLTSIDIIWLSDNGTILGIEDTVSPNTYPQGFYPPESVIYVLETRAGEARRQRWEVGSRIPLPLPYGS